MASAESALQVLALAAAPFTEPGLGLAAALGRVTQAVADLLGDGCVVRLLGADGATLVPAAMRHRSPARQGPFERLLAAAPVSSREGAHAQAIEAGHPLTFEASDARLAGPGWGDALREAGVGRVMLVALRTRGATLGTLDLTRDDPALPFTLSEELLLEDLAGRAALSIENGRLLDRERRERARAELSAWALREKVEELETSETRFRVAFEGAGIGMAVLSPRWEFLQTNPALRALLGYGEDDLRGGPFLAIVHAGDDAAARHDVHALREGGGPVSARRRLLRASGEPIWATVTASLVLNHSEQPHAIILHVQPFASAPGPMPAPVPPSLDLVSLGRILRNPVNVDLLRRLVQRPAYPRALARAMGRSEGDVQRKLRALEEAGLVASAWRSHEGVTIKEYQATTRTLQLSLA